MNVRNDGNGTLNRTMIMDHDNRNVHTSNKLYNDTFIFCRVSVPRHKAITNISSKSYSTSTRNRFEVLQTDEVSESVPPSILGDINNEPLQNKRDQKSYNGYNNKPKKSNSKKKNISQRDPNPTGDIWDQSSLNLDLLFQVKETNRFKIGVWNAESVRQKENLVKKYILDNDLDIFIILESWLHKDELPSTRDILPSIDSYKLHQMPRPNRKNSSGGGMLCIYKQNISIQKVPTISMKLLEVMDLKLSTRDKVIHLVSIYRPPRSETRRYPITDFYDDMENIVSHYKTLKDEVILCGDYNVHVNKPNEAETRRFNDILKSADLIQHINEKTHIKGNTLDLVISDKESKTIKKCTVDDFLSDHAVITIDLNMTKPPKSKKKVTFRRNKDVDLKLLESDIKDNLCQIDDTNDLNELVTKFNQALSDAYDKQAPLVTKTVIIRPPTPWTYEDIKEDKAKRRKLERRWRLTGLQIDRDRLREFMNSYNAKLNSFRNKQYAEMIENNKDDPTTLFKVINLSLHRKQSSPMPEGLTSSQLAEKFSEFFAEKISTIRAGIDAQQNDNTGTSMNSEKAPVDVPKLSNFTLLTENEVEKLIRDFPNKQCGLDPLPLALLKECLTTVLGHITKIVNLSLSMGDLSPTLKKAIITPLLKKLGLELILKNYRPVSNLSFLSKLIEKIVATQFVDHLRKNKLLDPLQSAYKRGHSTETALLKVQNDILMDIDKKNVSILVLLDLSAAFDTIDHEILLQRLKTHYGIDGNVLKWFESYLSDRTQSVIIEEEISEAKKLKYGVPQGSVLGPLLFTAYMAPMSDVISKYGLGYHCYADDTQLYLSFSPNSEVDKLATKNKLEQAIVEIKNFMIANKLKLNDDKTEVILMGTKQRLNDANKVEITVGETDIIPSDKVRNLGVIFDKNMSMDDQVKTVCKSGFYLVIHTHVFIKNDP